jgi:hypothetical protein
VAVAALVFSSVASVATGIKANKQAKQAAAAQQRQQALEYRRQQRQAIREAQIRRAQGLAVGQASGVASSSLTGGGSASVGSQLGSTLGFAGEMSGLSQRITALNQSASQYSAFSQLSGDLFKMLDGPAKLRSALGIA